MNHTDNQPQGIPSSLAEAARHRTVLDVGTQRVSRVYAEALLNAAEKHQQAEAVLDELRTLVEEVFAADPKLEAFFSSLAIGRRQKEGAIRKAFEGRASPLFLNFLLVLNDHERLGLLRAIWQEARDLRDQRAGRMRVEVRSAVPLPEDQRERLLQQLRETFRKEPTLEPKVDPDLLGGLVVRVGDWVYDSSVRTQLELIRNQILERSSHEIQSRRDRFSS